MPRTPLRSTSSNRTNRKELEPFQRGIIVGRFLAGQKKADIQREMNLPYTTIQTTIQTYQPSTTGTSSPRIGRPEILSGADKRYILLQIKRDPFIKTEDICKLLGMPLSTRTIARMLKESGYGHWRAQKRPQVTEKQLNYAAMDGHTCARIGRMSSGARLYGVMNVLLSLAKGNRINGYGGSTTSMKNGKRSIKSHTPKAKEYLS